MMMRRLIQFSSLVLLAAAFYSLNSCSKDFEDDFNNINSCDTVSMSLATHVKPILSSQCLGCHSTLSNQGGVKLEEYNDLKDWVDSGLLLSSIKHDGNAQPMPKSAPQMDACSINKITAWINQGALNN
jgi:hypothetical protein